MKARIFELDSDEHQAVQRLLPWQLNGTLDAAEAARVRAHLAECPRCQGELEWQARLRARAPAPAQADDEVERGWAAMLRQIEPPAPRGAGPAGAWPLTRWLQLAVGLEGALVLVLALAWLGVPPREETFRALGPGPAAMTANALVVFRADATEAEIRRALQAHGARLVDGPTVTDAYLLHLPSAGPELLSRLRSERAVERVESLESTRAEGTR